MRKRLKKLKAISPRVIILAFALLFLAGLDAFFVITFTPPEPFREIAIITVEKGAVIAPDTIAVSKETIVIEVEKDEKEGKDFASPEGEVLPKPAPSAVTKKAPFTTSPKAAKSSKRADDSCAKEALKKAIILRSMQSKLMVAALACEGAKNRYNNFALKYQKALGENGTLIMGYFKCKAGKKATVQFDKMITKIANLASALNSQNHRDFCDEAHGVFDELEEGEQSELDELAARHSYLDDDFAEEY